MVGSLRVTWPRQTTTSATSTTTNRAPPCTDATCPSTDQIQYPILCESTSLLQAVGTACNDATMATTTRPRPRSIRVAPSSNQTNSDRAQAPPTPTSTMPLAAINGSSGMNKAVLGSSSPLQVFLSNLRLLNLDLLPDWPDISIDTFTAVGSNVQSHKRRIHCVEWTLFQLFAIWDPEETAAVSIFNLIVRFVALSGLTRSRSLRSCNRFSHPSIRCNP